MSISESYRRMNPDIREIDSNISNINRQSVANQILYRRDKEEEKESRLPPNAANHQNLL